jgi:hypothetical protein
MTTATEATIEVPTGDLRKALAAVLPLAEKNSSGDNGVEHRIRLAIAESELYVMATNGLVSGAAAVPIDADSREVPLADDDGAFRIDITPRQVTMILRQFKAVRGPEAAGEMNETIELHATLNTLHVQDVGGLFVGEALEFPILEASTTFPDLPGLLGRGLASVGASPVGKPLVVDGAVLALFKPASTAYGKPLDIRSTGDPESPGFVVACGPWFVGLVSSRHGNDDLKAPRESAHRSWLGRFPAAKLAAV